MDAALRRHARRQAGLVSRRQVLAVGLTDRYIDRQLRQRRWARVHEGVYVDHTGPLALLQRHWAAVLVHEPAALAGRSALEAHGHAGTRRARPAFVELAVDRSRRVDDPPGVRTMQLRRFEELADLRASPPRLRIDPAALMVASRAHAEDGAVAVLADIVREGHTTTGRLRDALTLMPRLPRSSLLREVLADVDEGALSPLERRYLRDVERRHGLPRGERQVRVATRILADELVRVVLRDVVYRDHHAVVELDGVLGHAAALDRWADLDRDLVAAVHGSVTLRVGWQQALDPCRLAVLVGAVLGTRGWTGRPSPCSRDCRVEPARIA